MRRNLTVFCHPRKSGKWRRTLAHLIAGNRWLQFTGRKIIHVAYDDCCTPPDEVMSEWPAECEFIVQPNDAYLQEVAGFLPMMEQVESTDSDECTTYVHCKGSTQPDGHASHLWCDAMAQANLDYPKLVKCALQRGSICGAFRSHGLWGFEGYHNWHFAGTWFTFRHDRIFGELNWRNVHPNFMGVEAWPGIVPVRESVCLFYDNANTAHLYDVGFHQANIQPALGYWHQNLAKCGLVKASTFSQRILCDSPTA